MPLTFADVQVHDQRAQRVSQRGHGVDLGGDSGRVAILRSSSAVSEDRCEVAKSDGLTTSENFPTRPSITALQNLSSSSLKPSRYDCASRDHSASSCVTA